MTAGAHILGLPRLPTRLFLSVSVSLLYFKFNFYEAISTLDLFNLARNYFFNFYPSPNEALILGRRDKVECKSNVRLY